MSRFVRLLLSVAAAASVGLLTTFAVAVPASADHPAPEPRPYFSNVTGEDNCTQFHTNGEILWSSAHPGERNSITVTGGNAIAMPGIPPDGPNPCLPRPVEDRQVEFNVFGSDFPLGTEIVPFPMFGSGEVYEFDFSARIDIDTVEVAVCVPRGPDGNTWDGRCGESVLVHRDGEPDPGGEPQPFEYSSIGIDGCTGFEAEGTVSWADAAAPAAVVGTANRELVGEPIEPGGPIVCNPAYVYPRTIEFTAYLGENLIDHRAEWFTAAPGGVFDFELLADAAATADRIVIEICEYDDFDETPRLLHCSELATIAPDEPPAAPTCEHRFTAFDYGTGFLANIGVTPLEGTSTNWRLEADFPGEFTITSVWNAEWTTEGPTAIFTPPPWGAVLSEGSTLWVGFLGTGTPPNEVRLWIDGKPCAAGA